MPKHIPKCELDNYTHIIRQRAKLLGIPSQIAKSVANDFRTWSLNCGYAYTVDRFKTIKQCIIKYHAEGCRLPDDFYIKRKSGSKHFMYAHYGKLQELSLKDKKSFRKVLLFLNLYTLVSSKDGLTSHLADVHKEVIEKPLSTEAESYSDGFTALIDKNLMAEIKQLAMNNIPDNWEESKRESFKKKLRMFFYKPEDYVFSSVQKDHQENSFSYDWYTFLHSNKFAQLYSVKAYQPILNQLVSHFPQELILKEPDVLTQYSDYTMSNINLLEQGGLKYRYVAAFKKPLEHLVKPIGDMLYDLAACLPWDITFDESKCFTPIQNHLSQGKKVHSVDLKSATDRFPWKYQRKVAEMLYPNSAKWKALLDLYDELIHLPAAYSGESGKLGTWVVGQPLGSYPSFAIFTVTHGIVLYILNNFSWNGEFWIHGDDIDILDDELAEKYKNWLAANDIESSKFKTITSSVLAEINSKIITKERVFTIPKWKYFSSQNELEMIYHWGVGVIDIMHPNSTEAEKQMMRRIASLPFGEVSCNPLGLSLDQRVDGIEELLVSNSDRSLAYEGASYAKLARRYSIVVPTYAVYGRGRYKYTCYQRGLETAELNELRESLGRDFVKLFRVEETAPKYKTDPHHFESYLGAKEQGVLLDRAHLQALVDSNQHRLVFADGIVWTESTILELFKYNHYSQNPHMTVNSHGRRLSTRLSWEQKTKAQKPRLSQLLRQLSLLQSNISVTDVIAKEDSKMVSSPSLTMEA